MGTQTMGSEGGAFQEVRTQSLARQGSLYSLTLNEVQNQLGDLGKPLGSMNLDELLKSVWTAESSGNPGTGVGIGDASSHPSQLAPSPAAAPLQRQASLTLPRDLSKKTVDDVWKDIQQNKDADRERAARDRRPSFGEMTLEAFLMKAGVVSESPTSNETTKHVSGVDPSVALNQSTSEHAQWIQYQLPPPVQRPQQQHQQNMMAAFMQGQPFPISASPILEAAFSETQMDVSPPSLAGMLSDTQTPGRKRVASGGLGEKVVERRQKRMIKNRESAARSRARKQAYTHELENKISRLEEENGRLRRQQEIEEVLPSAPPPEPKAQIRRTSSASF